MFQPLNEIPQAV